MLVDVIVERLFRTRVTRKDESSPYSIKPGERAHPIELFQGAFRTPLMQCRQQDLRVRTRCKAFAGEGEFGTQFHIVIQLAVVYQTALAVLIGHGLKSGVGQIDDGKALVCEYEGAALKPKGLYGGCPGHDALALRMLLPVLRDPVAPTRRAKCQKCHTSNFGPTARKSPRTFLTKPRDQIARL